MQNLVLDCVCIMISLFLKLQLFGFFFSIFLAIVALYLKVEKVLWQWFFFFSSYKKAKSKSLLVLLQHESYCKSEWLDQCKFYWFSRFMCCVLVRIEKFSWPPQKPPFLFPLAFIHTGYIQPNNKWLPQPDQINFSNNMVDSSLVLKSQLFSLFSLLSLLFSSFFLSLPPFLPSFFFPHSNCNFLFSQRSP